MFDNIPAPGVYTDPPAGLFIGSETVRLKSGKPGAQIHFTTNGLEPGPKSPLYTKPIKITKMTNLKAIDSKNRSLVASVKFVKSGLRYLHPVKTPKLVNGLNYEIYFGQWETVPDFGRLTPIRKGIVGTFSLSPEHPAEYYGLRFTGYIRIPKTAIYCFHTASDDGSKLYIDDVLVVNNDGRHVSTEKSGDVALKAGMHKVRLDYFQNWGGEKLVVYYDSPWMERQIIHESELFRPK
jgi:hypothetical protein